MTHYSAKDWLSVRTELLWRYPAAFWHNYYVCVRLGSFHCTCHGSQELYSSPGHRKYPIQGSIWLQSSRSKTHLPVCMGNVLETPIGKLNAFKNRLREGICLHSEGREVYKVLASTDVFRSKRIYSTKNDCWGTKTVSKSSEYSARENEPIVWRIILITYITNKVTRRKLPESSDWRKEMIREVEKDLKSSESLTLAPAHSSNFPKTQDQHSSENDGGKESTVHNTVDWYCL